MQNPEVIHARNWNNKFFNDHFSSIRAWNKKKFKIDHVYSHYLNGEWVGDGVLEYAQKFPFEKLSEGMARLDSGLTALQMKKMLIRVYKRELDLFGNRAAFGFYVFRFIKKNEKYATNNIQTLRSAASRHVA